MVPDFVSKLRNLEVQAKWFSVVGIDLLADGKSSVVRRPIVFAYLFCCVCLTFVSKLWFAISKYEGIGKFAENLTFFDVSAFSVFLTLLYILRNNEITTLIGDMERLTAKVSPSERVEINVQSRREKVLSTVLSVLLVILVAVFCVPPLADGMISTIKNKKINVSAVMLGSYPYDNTNPKYYVASCILNGGMIIFAAAMAMGLDTLFFWYIQFLTAHFNILCSRFERFGRRLESTDLSTDEDRTFKDELGYMLAYYSTLNSFITRLDSLFAPHLFAIVLYSVGQLCLTSFQIRVAESISDSLVMILSCLCVLSQTMMFCFGGQVIKNYNDMLAENIYLSIPWHVLKKPMTRSLIFTLNRTQSGNCLTGYFFIANCELFVTILKAVSSYYAIFTALKDAE